MNDATAHSADHSADHSAHHTDADTADAHTLAADALHPGMAAPATPAGMRKSSTKAPRSRSREFALQGLYQFLVGHNEATDIDVFTRDLSGFHKADIAHYDALFHGAVAHGNAMDALITPLLDRSLSEISPVERACMWIGVYELQHCPDVPWRVVLNECIELAKDFGGTDGHKYVNAVLNGVAQQVRALEVQADRQRSARH